MLKTKLLISLVSALLIFTSQSLMADEALAKSKNCLACHGIDNKIVGPALKDIAAKYKGDASAVATLAAKVKNGGGGVWGAIPMPPNGTISEAEAEILIKWVLSL
jgi:cytochrome c551/c552